MIGLERGGERERKTERERERESERERERYRTLIACSMGSRSKRAAI